MAACNFVATNNYKPRALGIIRHKSRDKNEEIQEREDLDTTKTPEDALY